MALSLNADVLSIIAVDNPGIYAYMAGTCKTLNHMVHSIYSEKHRALANSDIVLRFHQALVRDTFFAMPQGTFKLRAVKSFGKTYTGYAVMDGCGMVLGTSDVTRVWVDHAKTLGWYDPDPKLTSVLCISDVAGHTKYANKAYMVLTGTDSAGNPMTYPPRGD